MAIAGTSAGQRGPLPHLQSWSISLSDRDRGSTCWPSAPPAERSGYWENSARRRGLARWPAPTLARDPSHAHCEGRAKMPQDFPSVPSLALLVASHGAAVGLELQQSATPPEPLVGGLSSLSTILSRTAQSP